MIKKNRTETQKGRKDMIELGKKQVLEIVKQVEFGVYLGTEDERVLLPKKQVPEHAQIGDEVEVFIYKDSADRLIATTTTPLLMMGQVALLKVADVTKIGAFLDWGLEKDLLLPFKEQTSRVAPGDECLVALYIDKSSRLCATMKIYHYLETGSPYGKEQEVTGRVYEISDNFGAFVAVDDRYSGLIPKKQLYGDKKIKVGDIITARVTAIKADGKLDLAIRQKAYLQMDEDAEKLLGIIDSFDGVLPFTDKANPEVIRRETGMSKNEFKRAVGRLYKERKIEITEKAIRRL